MLLFFSNPLLTMTARKAFFRIAKCAHTRIASATKKREETNEPEEGF